MKSLTVLLLSAFIISSSIARENPAEIETKDQKFIFNSNICIISKKEQDDAKEYILSLRDGQSAQLKLALTIIQLRLIKGAIFNEVNCGLRFFIEKYKDKNGQNSYNDSEFTTSQIVSEYLKILEKLRTDPKTKNDFEKNILSSNEIQYYYSVIGKNVSDYNLIEINLARRIFVSYLLNKNQRNFLQKEDWQIFFDLFYSKNTVPPKEINDLLKAMLISRNGNQGYAIMDVYLLNANELAFNDLFKSVFENSNKTDVSNYFSNRPFSPIEVKNVFQNLYLPENFKCTYAKEVVARHAPKLPKEGLDELNKLNIPCLKEALVDASKFTYPLNGCPQIMFGKNDDKVNLISKMSSEFSNAWTECRKKCSSGDKCISVQDNSGLYTFLNHKFEKDIPTYKDIMGKFSSRQTTSLPLKYDYKPVAICSEKGICGEKISSCSETDIIKKMNDELKAAKYQACKEDNDCYILPVGFAGCTEFAVNVNTVAVMNPGLVFNNKNRRIVSHGPQDFFTSRLLNLANDCNKLGEPWVCQQQFQPGASNSTTTPKCVKNLCVISK